ncbi:uncharacterized protein LOC126418765 [Schistocerca serialis cubense]|uniref:uncharacterized protein LOC126418765 n=1 Tax=Schistocerca serialis cubense TaxID=2023355 RepID=UPI00214EB7A6|nr:uncharacterized protein LOC126418765 [Schistocerca serialis cubense]
MGDEEMFKLNNPLDVEVVINAILHDTNDEDNQDISFIEDCTTDEEEHLLERDGDSDTEMRRSKEEFCKLGTTFLSGCNTCICGANNKPSFCFPKACKYEIPVGIKPCVPGTTLMVECNRCTCGINGKAQQCTKNKCRSSSEPVKSSRFKSMTAQLSEDKCVPGTMLRKSCNTCKCSKSGRPIHCTNLQCHPLLGVGVQGCVPGDLVKVYCSTCKCSSTGTLTDCTNKDCDIRAAPNEGKMQRHSKAGVRYY